MDRAALIEDVGPHRYRHELTPMFQWIKDRGVQIERVMEIGVYDGGMATHILWAFPSIKKYYAIDPWHFEEAEKEGQFSHKKMHRGYLQCQKLQKHFPSLLLVPRISERGIPEVSEILDGAQLDAVYIDAVHKASAVRTDFELSFPLVKPGGVIGGHDFTNFFDKKTLNQYVLGELAREYRRTIHLHLQATKGETNNFDWWIVK